MEAEEKYVFETHGNPLQRTLGTKVFLPRQIEEDFTPLSVPLHSVDTE